MASPGQSEIVLPTTQPAAAEENEILQWVAKVDEYIDSESIEILKLSMGSELTQRERDEVKSPSDLYHALANHYSDPAVHLARFVYALEKLGHRRYGSRAVRELGQANGIIFDHTKLNGDINIFLLHQHLADLCCMLPNTYYSKFIDHFAKELLKINPSTCKTPCEILTKVLEKGILTTDKYINVIEDALIKVGLSENKIKVYIESCQRAVDSGHIRNTSCAPTSSSKTSRPSTPGHESETLASRSNEGTPLLQDVSDGPQSSHANLNKKRKCLIKSCSCTILLTLLTLAAGAAIFLGFAIKHYQQNRPTTQRYHENSSSSVILTELNHFFTESLTVMEDLEHQGDIQHDIDVYRVESMCSVITNRTVFTIDGAENTSLPPFYALAGSSVFLEICGSTTLTTYPERLEILLQDHLEEPNSIHTPYKVKSFEPGLNGEPVCKNITFALPHNNYYTLTFVTPKTPMTFTFKLTYDLQVIDVDLLVKHTRENFTLHADQESCSFAFSWDIKHSCFVAMIRENHNVFIDDVHIQLTYGNRWSGLIAGAILLLIFAAAIVVLAVCYRKLSHRTSHSNATTVHV